MENNIEGLCLDDNLTREDEIRLALEDAFCGYKGQDKELIFDTYFNDVKYYNATLKDACKRISILISFYEKK